MQEKALLYLEKLPPLLVQALQYYLARFFNEGFFPRWQLAEMLAENKLVVSRGWGAQYTVEVYSRGPNESPHTFTIDLKKLEEEAQRMRSR